MLGLATNLHGLTLSCIDLEQTIGRKPMQVSRFCFDLQTNKQTLQQTSESDWRPDASLINLYR